MTRDFHAPGRSAVYAGNGMVATSHPLASLAAIETLKAGGNAADAAVAAIAIAGVVEPQMSGIGGDCFCLVAKPGQPVWGYNGSGRSAAAMRAQFLIDQGLKEIAPSSVHSVTVPGAVEAWDTILKTHGRFGLDRTLSFAIDAAEQGVPVPPRVQFDWSLAQAKLAADPVTAKIYLPGGAAPNVGDVMRFPALAATLRKIAKGGARAFYEGEIAADIVATLKARGGLLTAEDFATHRGEEASPIASAYRGLDVIELPPNGQGVAALLLLNMLERFDISALDPVGADRLHLLLEAGRLAYAVRNRYVADPALMQVPVAALLDRAFAAELAKKIDLQKRTDFGPLPKPPSSTVLCCVVDSDRNAVTIINSLFSTFGSGITTGNTGILLHHRGSGFNLDPASPNCIGPSKRPLHTIIPALAARDGRVDMAFGVMGGAYQAFGHAHFISNLIDYDMELQAAIDQPRVFFEGEPVVVESGVSEAVLQNLRSRGHEVIRRQVPLGGAQAIRIDWQRGVLIGGSDARKDGCALGY
jgi:gamma-glutamyltranspeptidase/glutathione hydrolase